MKKHIAFLLCFVTVFSLCSCNIYEKILPMLASLEPTMPIETTPSETTSKLQETTPEQQETTTPESQGTTTEPQGTTTSEPPKELTPPQLEGYPLPIPEPEANVFGSYEEILDIYRLAIERFDLIDAPTETIARTLGFSNVKQVEWFETILMSSYLYYYGDDKDARDATVNRLRCFTYTQTDLNGDGIEELILLALAQDVLAIFSKVDDKPVLLGNYTPRNVCEVDDQGLLHVTEKGSGDSYSKRVYEIARGGNRLNKLAEYGVDDLLFSNFGYYVESNGKKVSISSAGYYALEREYGTYNTVWLSVERMLFSSTRLLRAVYQPAIDGEVPIYFTETGEYLFLKDYIPPNSSTPLSKRGGLKCSFGNFDNDQARTLDCIIYYGEPLLLTYDYITGTVSARSLTDKEKLIASGGVYYPLPAWWREVDITAQEIKESVPGYCKWEVYDGLREEFGYMTMVNRILVSSTPDEHGYYLVTWQKDISPTNCSCLDCDIGIPHAVKIQRYLLIHAKTGEIIEIGVSPQEAKEIAGAYWNTYDGYVNSAAGSTYVRRIIVAGKPEYDYGGMYYHVVWQSECYSHEGYQNGAEPYYISNLKHLYIHVETGECYMYPAYDEGK